MHQRIKTNAAIVSEVHTSTMRWNPWRITTRGRWMPLGWNFRTIVAVIMESDICNKRMWIYPAWGIFISFKIYTKQVDTWLHIATYPFYCIVSRISLYIKYLNTRYSIHLWTYNGYAMIFRNYIECCFDIDDNISENCNIQYNTYYYCIVCTMTFKARIKKQYTLCI